MTDKRRVRPRLGDVVRITANNGAAADAQYTHKNATHGALLRVFGPAPAGPTPLGDEAAAGMAAQAPQFLAFFPLGAACARGIATIIGNAPLPADATPFPLFRVSGRHLPWLWDGEREWRVHEPPPDYAQLPIREIVNDTLLVERAHQGWRHERDA
jgi:hypothetical protein